MKKKKQPSMTRQARLDAFVQNRLAPFSLDEVISGFPGNPSTEAIYELLMEHDLLFADPYADDLFFPRASFFKGCSFLIKPTEHERNLNVIFPGHRFMPFLSMRTFPADTTLLWKGTEPLPKKTVACPMKEVIIYHTLFGEAGLYNYFLTDHADNAWLSDIPQQTSKKLYLTVFDMAEVSGAGEFGKDDKLLCTVINWQKGVFSVEPARGGYEQDMSERIDSWCAELDEALEEGWVDPQALPPSINEQLAYAFFTSEAHLSRMPGMHIGGYLNHSQRISIRNIAGNNLLCPNDLELPAFLGAMGPSEPIGTIGTLDEMMADVGLSMNAIELRAYMRDALFNDIRDIRKVKDRCFAGRNIQFYDDIQEKEFYAAIAAQWREVKKDYNLFTDHHRSAVRAKLLDINDAILAHLRNLDRAGVDLQDLPEESTMGLGELSGIVSGTLGLLDESTSDKAELDSLSLSIDELWVPVQSLIEEACEDLRAKGFDL